MADPKLDERTCSLLKQLIDEYWKEDREVRERQIRKYRHLKLLWDGWSRVWWSDTAHDWRVWDNTYPSGDGDQDFYDKPMNVFKAFLETIIAALSTSIPRVKCYPDDADNPLDLLTAKAGDKIGQLIDRHNNFDLLWLQGLFIFCTEGLVACYTYPKESYEYGSYEEDKYEDFEETHRYKTCSLCGEQMADEVVNDDEFQPDNESVELQEVELCENCMQTMQPDVRTENLTVTRLVGVTKNPKTRVCQEVYGGLYVKVPTYAKKQADCPYLIQSYETNYALARARFTEIREKIQPSDSSPEDPYGRWGRQNSMYQGEWPINQVTIRNSWFRTASFEVLESEDDVKHLKKMFPDGVRVTAVNDNIAEYENESLDDCWTLTHNPLSDFLVFEPLGSQLVPTQELTNDIISLTEQTIEHGIPQTFADESVLDFKAYGQMESTPGSIFPAKARAGKSVADGFYEVKTATLSQEVLPFFQLIQSLGQTIVGAQPSLFGGELSGSKTASEYSQSRAQALQRLQNTWKMFTSWRKEIMGKAIPLYIKNVKDDERYVEQDDQNNFINVFIRKSELEGKIGNIELESSENLPSTWAQKKDVVLQMLEANNPAIAQMIMTPENLPLIYEMIGLPDFSVPGEDSRNKQYDEIKTLCMQEPIVEQPTPDEMAMAQMESGQPAAPIEYPSVEVEEFDNHAIELEICMKYLNSEAGQLLKKENPPGYMNVVLHARMHKMAMMPEMMEQQAQGAAPLPNTKEDMSAPIKEDSDVQTQS